MRPTRRGRRVGRSSSRKPSVKPMPRSPSLFLSREDLRRGWPLDPWWITNSGAHGLREKNPVRDESDSSTRGTASIVVLVPVRFALGAISGPRTGREGARIYYNARFHLRKWWISGSESCNHRDTRSRARIAATDRWIDARCNLTFGRISWLTTRTLAGAAPFLPRPKILGSAPLRSTLVNGSRITCSARLRILEPSRFFQTIRTEIFYVEYRGIG